MKARMFSMFALIIASALLLIFTLTMVAQGAEIQDPSQVVMPDMVSYGLGADLSQASQNQAGSGYTSEITFTPVAAAYLPAVFRNYGGCSAIPTLLSPANGSSLNTIALLFRWDNGNNPNATVLRLQVAKDPGFTQGVWSLRSSRASGVSEFRFPRNWNPAATYYWRAWLMCGDVQGPYSEVWSFTTGSGGTILPAPTLVAPTNGSTSPTTTVNLQWSPVSGAIEYLVYWREAGDRGYFFWSVSATQTTISQLKANTTYEWWISARNDYAIGTNSETWRFTTPAGSSSLSPQNLNRNSVEEDGSATIVFEDRTASNER
jgi:hypothetical protein